MVRVLWVAALCWACVAGMGAGVGVEAVAPLQSQVWLQTTLLRPRLQTGKDGDTHEAELSQGKHTPYLYWGPQLHPIDTSPTNPPSKALSPASAPPSARPPAPLMAELAPPAVLATAAALLPRAMTPAARALHTPT